MKGVIVNAKYQMEYLDDKTSDLVYTLFVRCEDGKKRSLDVYDTKPYFCVDSTPDNVRILNQLKDSRKIIDFKKSEVKNIHGKPVIKVFVKAPFDVPHVRSSFKYHYEADVEYSDRVRIDNGWKYGIEFDEKKASYKESDIKSCVVSDIKFNTIILDIETDDTAGSTKDNPIGEVLCISVYSYSLDKYMLMTQKTNFVESEVIKKFNETFKTNVTIVIKVFDSEKEMLSYFRKIFGYEPDIISGWNITYDSEYLKGRDQTIRFDEANVLDLMDGYVKVTVKDGLPESKKLDFISEKETRFNKLKMPHKRYKENFNKCSDLFLAYNLGDVHLCKLINDKLGITDFFKAISEVSGCEIGKCTQYSKVDDLYTLYFCSKKYILPSRFKEDMDDIDKGAVVQSPSTGLFYNVACFDFVSAYPSAIRTLNLSPETQIWFEDGYKTPCGRFYRKEPRGILPLILDELINLRNKYKKLFKETGDKKYDLLQNAVKVLMNSFYGVMGFGRETEEGKKSSFRLASSNVGSDITGICREMVTFFKKCLDDYSKAHDMKIEIVYGDTDSLYCSLNLNNIDEIIRNGEEIEKYVNDNFHLFAESMNQTGNHFFKVEFEKVFGTYFQSGKKKRYAGRIIFKDGKMLSVPKTERKGFESRRSDASFFAKNTQKEFFELVLDEASFKQLSDFVIKKRKDMVYDKKSRIESKIPRGWGKEYEGEQINERAAKYSNEHFGSDFRIGDKIFYVYMKNVCKDGKVYPNTDVIALEIDDDPCDFGIVDWEKMIERNLSNPINNISEGLGYTYEQLISGIQPYRVSEEEKNEFMF